MFCVLASWIQETRVGTHKHLCILYHFNLRFTGCDMWHMWTLSGQVHREKIGVSGLSSFYGSVRANRPNFFGNPIWCKVHSCLWHVMKSFLCSIHHCLWYVTEPMVKMVQYHSLIRFLTIARAILIKIIGVYDVLMTSRHLWFLACSLLCWVLLWQATLLLLFWLWSLTSFSPSSATHLHLTPASDLLFLSLLITSPFTHCTSISLSWACTSVVVSFFHLHSPALSALWIRCLVSFPILYIDGKTYANHS